MATTINASTANGLIQSADTSGILELQANGVTQLTVTGTGSYGNLVRGVVQTASGTAVNFNDIPSWVKRITVMFSGVSTSGTSNYQIQLGDSGGIETTGYTGSAVTPSADFDYNSTGLVLMGGIISSSVNSGIVTISNVSGNTWVSSGIISASASGYFGTSAGEKTLSATLDRIRITTVNGTDTFDAGSINIMYEG